MSLQKILMMITALIIKYQFSKVVSMLGQLMRFESLSISVDLLPSYVGEYSTQLAYIFISRTSQLGSQYFLCACDEMMSFSWARAL